MAWLNCAAELLDHSVADVFELAVRWLRRLLGGCGRRVVLERVYALAEVSERGSWAAGKTAQDRVHRRRIKTGEREQFDSRGIGGDLALEIEVLHNATESDAPCCHLATLAAKMPETLMAQLMGEHGRKLILTVHHGDQPVTDNELRSSQREGGRLKVSQHMEAERLIQVTASPREPLA